MVSKLLFLIIFFSIISSCQKDNLNNTSDKEKNITTAEVISKFHLQNDDSTIRRKNSIESSAFARTNSLMAINDSDVTQTFPFETTLYFTDAQEANEFLSYVQDDPNKVIQYYSSHPNFYKRQLYYNGIISDTTSNSESIKCSTCKIKKEDFGNPPCGPGEGNFCQDYLSFFTKMCVGILYNFEGEFCSTGNPEGSSTVYSVHIGASGWMLGFACHDDGGYGNFIDMYNISFITQFHISLSLFWNGIGTFYNYPMEAHTGTYNVYYRTGAIYQ